MPKKFIGNVKGVGVASAIREYYSSTSATAVVGGTWQSTVPTLDSSHYLWTRLKLTLTNGKVEVTEAIREGMFGEEIENLVATVNSINSAQQSQGNKINTIAPNNTVDVAHGGTGKSSHTTNAVLTGNGTNAVNNAATANGALYATSANGAPKFGVLPIGQGGTGSTSASGARTNLGIDGKLFTQYALNSINIDSTGGNWTVDISETGHGAIPMPWVNVIQTTGAHFIVQIAIKCDTSQSTSGRDQRMWIRDKYSSGVWSNWKEVLTENRGVQMVKLWENTNLSARFGQQDVSLPTDYNFYAILYSRTEASTENTLESMEFVRVQTGRHAVLEHNDDGTVYQRELVVGAGIDGFISFLPAYKTGTTTTKNTWLVPMVIYGIKGVL